MNALVLTRKKTPVSYIEIDNPESSNEQVLVQIKAAALNQRDILIRHGKYAGLEFPFILGSDGVGIADGQTALLNPSMYSGKRPHIASSKHQIVNGTLAEWIALPSTQIYSIPTHLTIQQAAALPTEGLTAYRALFSQGACQASDKVLITNIEANNSLLAMQFAIACGAEVYVTARTDEALEKAVLMGAKGGANNTVKLWSKDLFSQTNGFDLILDSIGGAGFIEIIRLTAMGCRIVTCGGLDGFLPKLNANLLARKQIALIGSSMGNAAEFSAMLAFVQEHQIVPVIDSVFDLCDGVQAFEHFENGNPFGKIVLNI